MNEDQGDGGVSQTSIVITTVNVTGDPLVVPQGGTSKIDATVLDQLGNVIKDGTVVHFDISDDTLGTIESSAITLNGVATVTLSVSSNNLGIVTITARAGSVSGTVNIEVVEPVAVGKLENAMYVTNKMMSFVNLS